MVTPKIGYPKKMVTPENWLPQKIDPKKRLPQTFWRTLLRGGLLLHLGKMAYFIVGGFIIAIPTLGYRCVSLNDSYEPGSFSTGHSLQT